MYEFMASPVISAAGSAFEMLGASGFKDTEQKQGEFALAAFLYEEGANISGRLMLLLWGASVSAPRLAELAKKRAEKEKRKAEQGRMIPHGNPNPTEVPPK